MKKSKEDKRFMIAFDQVNRDFLINVSMFSMSFVISIVSLLIATLSMLIALDGVNEFTITIAAIFALIIVVFAIPTFFKIKKSIANSFEINKQLQKELLEIYPEYKRKFR